MQYTHNLHDLRQALSDVIAGDDDATEGSEGTPLSRYREISQDEIQQYREQITWVDNKDYQRDDHTGACGFLEIANRDNPRI
jgi:hypothetical protein